jgi:hypothetical protein
VRAAVAEGRFQQSGIRAWSLCRQEEKGSHLIMKTGMPEGEEGR